MATTFRMFVFATFLLSCIACALLVVAVATPHWINAEAKVADSVSNNNVINYGLIGGELKNMVWSTPRISDLYITCLPDETVCMFSCLASSEEREAEAKRLLKKDYTYIACPTAVRSMVEDTESTSINDKTSIETKAGSDPIFMSFIIWIFILIFLGLALLMGIVSAFFSVFNTATNPDQPILAIFGLYIWNAIGAICCVTILLIWGIYFIVVLSINIAVFETISKRSSSEGLATLGYSYWMVLGTFFIFCANIVILLVRQWKLNRLPEPQKVELDNVRDGILYLY